jgi:hypothetical protein
MFHHKLANAIGICVGIVFLCLVGAILAGSSNHTISRDESYVQQKINEHLPKTEQGITIKDATVHFQDNRAEFGIDVEGTKFGKEFSLVVDAVGVPDYEHSHGGEFYFRPDSVKVRQFAYMGESPEQAVHRFADRYVTNRGVKNALEDAAPHLETWVTGAAQSSAMLALRDIPIYRLKDDNIGFFIRAALEKVEIQGNDLVITFSLWGIVKTILWAIVLGGMVVIVIMAVVGVAMIF